MVPQVGTSASSILVLNLTRARKISYKDAITMLSKLPLDIRVPNEKLLKDMDALVNLEDSIHIGVRKAAILCYSSMVYRTMKNLPNPHENELVQTLLQKFFDKIKSKYFFLARCIARSIFMGEIFTLKIGLECSRF